MTTITVLQADITGYALSADLPQACIDDCTGPGDAQDAVSYWLKKLKFSGPADQIRNYLSSFGAWDDDELADDMKNLQRLLWSAANDEKERQSEAAYQARR